MQQSNFIKNQKGNEEIQMLKSQLANMQTQLHQLQVLAERTNADLRSLKVENEILISDLQNQNKHNRILKQQLEDERFFYLKEKEYFCRELCSKKSIKMSEERNLNRNDSSYNSLHQKRNELTMASLKAQVEDLQIKMKHDSQLSSTLCQKFLRMKHTRDKIASEYDKLQGEYLKVMADVMSQLDDTRKEVNMLIDGQFQQHIHPSSAVTLQILQRNSRLMHENSQLRVEIQKIKLMNQKYNKNENRHFNKHNVRSSSYVIRHHSTSVLENSLRNTEDQCIVQRYKPKPNAAETLKNHNPKLSHTISQRSHLCSLKPKELATPFSRNVEHADLDYLWASNTHPSRTMSAPEILETAVFQAPKRKSVNTKESSTNT